MNNPTCCIICKQIFSIMGLNTHYMWKHTNEIKLFDLCLTKYKNITHNDSTIADGWDADILLHDYKLAILWNGPWHYKQMNLKNHSLNQVKTRDKIKIDIFKSKGWEVLIFEDKSFTPEQAFEEIKRRVAETGV